MTAELILAILAFAAWIALMVRWASTPSRRAPRTGWGPRRSTHQLPPEVQAAVADVDRAMHFVWSDIGPHFTCSEVNALVNLLHALGLYDAAAMVLEGHAESDEDDDEHYRGDEEDDDDDERV